jgi:hypothetical protein
MPQLSHFKSQFHKMTDKTDDIDAVALSEELASSFDKLLDDPESEEPKPVEIKSEEVKEEVTQLDEPKVESVIVEEIEEKVPEEIRTEEIDNVGPVVDQFENLTVFGNKSLVELHKIQSKKSHLSAGNPQVNLCKSFFKTSHA